MANEGPLPNPPLYQVEYNDFGCPIGGENIRLCGFLGSIARDSEYCPLNAKNWSDVSREKKIQMLDVVKSKFHVPTAAENWVLACIGRKWRHWKYLLKAKNQADVPIERLANERDNGGPFDQWINLVTHRKTEEAQEKTEKVMHPRLLAHVQQSAKLECKRQEPEDYENSIRKDDVFAQIMGKGKPRMWILGKGICSLDACNEIDHSTSSRLLLEHQSGFAHMESILVQQGIGVEEGESQHPTSMINPLPNNAMATLSLPVVPNED